MRTDKEITDEIKKLSEMKPNVRRYSMFGDDNWTKIDAQITVLTERLDDSDIDEKQDSGEWNDDEASNAREAAEWLEGGKDLPSKGWKPLLNK